MPTYYGRGQSTIFSLGQQTALGTEVATTYRVIPQELQVSENLEKIQDIGAHGIVGPKTPLAITAYRPELRVGYRASPKDLGHALRRMFGPPSTAAAGASAYDHTWLVPPAAGFSQVWFPWPYTAELYLDLQANSLRWADLCTSDFSFSTGITDRVLKIAETLKGRSAGTSITKTTPSADTLAPFYWHQLGVGGVAGMTIGGTPFAEVKQITFTPKLGLVFEDSGDGNTGYGACWQNAAEVGFEISGTIRPLDLAEYTAFAAGTLRDYGFVFTGPVIETTYKHTLTINVDSLELLKCDPPAYTSGRLEVPFTARALYNAGLTGLAQIILRTNIASFA